eukprot:6760366-Pyramimonas_sp.AAC.1
MFDDCCVGCHGPMAQVAAYVAQTTMAVAAQLVALGCKVPESKSEALASSPELAALVAKQMGGTAFPIAGSVKNLGVDFCFDGQAFTLLEARHTKAAAQLQRLHAIPGDTSSSARGQRGAQACHQMGCGLSAAGWPSPQLTKWRRQVDAIHHGRGPGKSLSFSFPLCKRLASDPLVDHATLPIAAWAKA